MREEREPHEARTSLGFALWSCFYGILTPVVTWG